MSNKAQINANRRNSQKSTGPRSAEGKAVVAKNAVKHGLFALESVIKGEKQEDFDLFRDEMLAELAPAGAVESMLAERFVSLSWRLQRVERIQNQAIDAMIDKQLNSPVAKMTEMMLPKSLRRQNTDGPESDLTLGKVAMRDFSGARVLERLLMYERRIENSILKTMDELRKRRLMRELEQASAEAELGSWAGSPCHVSREEQLVRNESATRLPQDASVKGFVRDEAPWPRSTTRQKQKNEKQSQFPGLSGRKSEILNPKS